MRYRTKTLKVLKDIFQYQPNTNGPQEVTFKAVTRQINEIKGNEFDAAVAFMFTQLESGFGFEGGDRDWEIFRNKVITDAAYCSDHAVLEITKETANGLFEANWETKELEGEVNDRISAEFDELINIFVAIFSVNKEFMLKSNLYDDYIKSDESFGYVFGFIDGFLQTRTKEFLKEVGQDEMTIINTVLSVVFQEIEFDENYLPIDRLNFLQNKMETHFMAAMVEGGNAAFEAVKQEHDNSLHWLSHFEEFSLTKKMLN